MEWEEAKADLQAARDLGCDVAAEFLGEFCGAAEFEGKFGVKLPSEVTTLLRRRRQ